MHRYLATGLLLCAHGVFAAGPAPGAAQVTTAPLDLPGVPMTLPQSPAQVMPPLPSLASLPPPVEPPPAHAVRTRGRRASHATVRAAPPVEIRTVVSDASHAYLAEIDATLDAALAQ